MRNPLAGYAVSVTGTLALLALVTGFVPGGSNQSLEPVTGATSRAKGENPLPRPLLHIPEQVLQVQSPFHLLNALCRFRGPFSGSGGAERWYGNHAPAAREHPGQAGNDQYIPCGDADRRPHGTPAGRFCSPRGTVFEYAPHQSGGTRPSRCAGQTAGF